MPFGLVGVVGKAERVGRAGVPDALGDLGVEMVMAEQDEVGLKRPEVDLDLVDVSVPGLDLLDPRVGDAAGSCARLLRDLLASSRASSVASTLNI